MVGEWYVKIGRKRAGPLTWERLKQLAQRGRFSPDDLIREKGQGPWVRAGQVPGLFADTVSVRKSSGVSSLPVAKLLEEPAEQPEAEPASQTTPVPETPPAVLPVVEPVEEPPAESRVTSTATVPPASEDAPSEFQLVTEPRTARVTGRSGRAAKGSQKKRTNNAIIAITVAMLLVAVSIAGVGLMMSGKEPSGPAERSGSVLAEPVTNAGQQRPQEPEVADIEGADIEDLEFFEGLEGPTLLGSAKPEPPSAKTEKIAPAKLAGASDRPRSSEQGPSSFAGGPAAEAPSERSRPADQRSGAGSGKGPADARGIKSSGGGSRKNRGGGGPAGRGQGSGEGRDVRGGSTIQRPAAAQAGAIREPTAGNQRKGNKDQNTRAKD